MGAVSSVADWWRDHPELTLDDIADSANAVLAEYGYPPHSANDYRFFIGGGVDILFEPVRSDDDAIDRSLGM